MSPTRMSLAQLVRAIKATRANDTRENDTSAALPKLAKLPPSFVPRALFMAPAGDLAETSTGGRVAENGKEVSEGHSSSAAPPGGVDVPVRLPPRPPALPATSAHRPSASDTSAMPMSYTSYPQLVNHAARWAPPPVHPHPMGIQPPFPPHLDHPMFQPSMQPGGLYAAAAMHAHNMSWNGPQGYNAFPHPYPHQQH
ncbi:hypothetical protein CONPUDRAFT_81574 [Coniophora puteana RWD-64-598 SS2]|uniref:Uncharacterized protein n=1 Tax=Coniophora puteana (strain RWD-64-598) TaxID=741705 RepID=A0A5M3MRY7_CONPW|nr:uncharacterized protein CONPUDRAFT_81574 [Coniophora puteana RWD-64-598 SS2]EIW81922.1 hypothetical protein CONPUDRAFT_81574 [Coniophora puteana RWD-64-598 SS2]